MIILLFLLFMPGYVFATDYTPVFRQISYFILGFITLISLLTLLTSNSHRRLWYNVLIPPLACIFCYKLGSSESFSFSDDGLLVLLIAIVLLLTAASVYKIKNAKQNDTEAVDG